MKLIGIVGGVTWQSTLKYYQGLNQKISQNLGGHHSAHLLLYSFDFAEIESLQKQKRWEEIAQKITQVANQFEQNGANFYLIATNTLHRVADQIQSHLPLLHIVDPIQKSLLEQNVQRVALLGTQYTLEASFFQDKLNPIEVILPQNQEQDWLQKVIFEELCFGVVTEKSKQQFYVLMENLVDRGAEAIILGCTELPFLLEESREVGVPLMDTVELHINAAVQKALN